MSNRLITSVLLISLMVAGLALNISAAVPGLISYQGRVTTSAGQPVADGAYFIRFQIYDAPVGGTSLWNSNIQPVQVKDGVYTYILGQDVPFPNGLFSGGNRWLGVTIGVDSEMTPRQQMIATGYAFVSQNADSVGWSGIKNMPAGFADGIDDVGVGDITAVNTSGGLTGGVTSGDANISIASGGVTSSHIANSTIVDADIAPGANIAPSKISGTAATLSSNQAFTGTNSFSNLISFGDSTMRVNNTGIAIGGNYSPNSINIVDITRSLSTASTRYALRSYLYNSGTGIVVGLASKAESTGGGQASGVIGEAAGGQHPTGVEGIGSGGSSTNYGVEGHASGNSTGQNVGVMGRAADNQSNGYGLFGSAQESGGVGYGVFATASGNSGGNWAGYFSGDVNVTGTIFTPAKLTKLDHPVEPESKYLIHSSIESSEMINTYSGNVTLDESGTATITLPDWFELINTDYRYHLTCIGGFAPVFIAQEVANRNFKIAGGSAGMKVSWQITARRTDQFARAFPMTVEIEKRADERGKYLHPQAFGLEASRGIDFEHNQAIEPTDEN